MRERLRGLPLRDIALLAVAIALITTFNLLGAHNGEEQAQSLDSYSSYDAASGGYRAWYELLQREKIGVERFEQRPAFLDRKLDTLVWSEPIEFDPRQTSNTKADIRALQDWVKAGGRFVYLGHDENAAKQGVLKLPRTKALKNAKDDGKNLTIAAELSSEGVGRVAFDTNLRWKAPKRATVLVADAAGSSPSLTKPPSRTRASRAPTTRVSRSCSRTHAAPAPWSPSTRRRTGISSPRHGGRSCRARS